MQIYTHKPNPIRMGLWNGGHDEQVITDLRDLGFQVFFQVSPQDTEKDWSEAEGKEIEVPASGRMVVVGPYNWDTWHIAQDRYITFRLVHKVTGDRVEWTDENLADPDNKIHLGDRDKSVIDSDYEIVG